MHPFKLAAALLFAFAATPSLAAEPPASAPATVERIDNLLEIMDAKAVMEATMRQMTDSQRMLMLQTLDADATPAERERVQQSLAEIAELQTKYLGWERLAPVMRKAYADVFSAREVDAMIAFYGTPEGAATLRKTPQVMAATLQAMQPMLQEMLRELEAGSNARINPTKH